MSSNADFFPQSSESFDDHGTLDQVPLDVSHLAAAANESYPSVTIGFRHAPKLFHTQIQNYQPPDYYEDYLMTASYSARMQELQADQARCLAAWHEGPPASLVEIGCGDGSFLKHCARHFPRVVGIEPSRRFAVEARKAGLEVFEGYVTTERLLTKEKFDAFASRQVFEHLPDPVDVLRGIRQMVRPGAVGLIEVPNGFRALRRGRFYEFFPDHVQYYSANSLAGLATEAGFNLIECREAFGGDYLEMWLRYVPDAEEAFQRLQRVRAVICEKLAGWLRDCQRDGVTPVAVWGAGAKTLSILAAARDSMAGLVACVIDSDPHKHGRFVPNTAIPIVSPDGAAAYAPAAVLILALSYREEIAALVRRHLPSCRRIATLDDEGEVVLL